MPESIEVLQSAVFRRSNRRLHSNQQADVDDAVAQIVRDATTGEAKEGYLAGIFVHKFRCNGQLTRLAYEFDRANRLLLVLGSHENFYRDLKR
ncbi:MAG: type II toxin-antitoxin system RelE/ParE family toxin [Polaromonas sp.]|nr:type II toxin-antitoxin system RelE/ParE family toxin [Polaromonas sp.]